MPAGVDGEAIHLDPPLQFRIRPGALRVRIAAQHPGASPCALVPDKPWALLHALVRVYATTGRFGRARHYVACDQRSSRPWAPASTTLGIASTR